MRTKNILFILLALTVLGLAGCGKDKAEPTEVTLEVIEPDTTTAAETISDKLEEPSKTYVIETSPEPKGIGIGEDGETKVIEQTTSVSETESESLTPEEESKKALEESSLAVENNQKLKEIQESALESIEASDETMSASEYQQINDAISEYNKKQVEEWNKKVDWSK